jgi:trans-aconitate methyltransferase
VIGWLAEVAAPRPLRRVMDVGAGPGVAAGLFAQVLPEAEVLAFDPGRALLDRALVRAEQRGVADRFHVKQGSIGPDLSQVPS